MPGDRPFALVHGDARGGQVLYAVNACARRMGVAAGLALADARAAVPSLATRPAEPELDRRALRRLALWSGRYGPRRNVDGDDGLWIDATGVSHLFGGETALLRDLTDRLAGAGVTARVAIADTLGAAHALARHGPGPKPIVVPPGEAAKALAGIKVEALRLEADTVLLLKRLGLRHIGQIYDLPRAALAQRFRLDRPGRGSVRRADAAAENLLARLDQALGRQAEPRRPLAEPPEHRVQCLFAEPLLSMDGVMTATLQAIGQLVAGLAERNLGIRRLRVALYRTDGTVAMASAGTSAPTRDAAHLAGLLADRIGGLDAGFGIDAVTAEAIRTDVIGETEDRLAIRLSGTARQDPRPFFDRVAARIGAEHVFRLAPVDSHWPDHAERRVSLLADEDRDVTWPAAGTRAERPAFLLPAPEPISVVAEIPDGPPARFVWRRMAHRVVRAEGPERIAPEWWRSIGSGATEMPARLARTRDYYRVENAEGGRFWVFRSGLFDDEAEDTPPGWYLHGLFG